MNVMNSNIRMSSSSNTCSSSNSNSMYIACMHNEAVHLLLAGEDDQALRLLRESLVLMKRFVDPRPPFCNDDSTSSPTRTEETMYGISTNSLPFLCPPSSTSNDLSWHHHPEANPASNSSTSSLNSSSQQQQQQQPRCCDGRCSYHLPSSLKLTGLEQDAESSQTFIYSKPFLFPDELSSKDMGCFLHIHCAVVIFNMALAHHHMAKSMSTSTASSTTSSNSNMMMCDDSNSNNNARNSMLAKTMALYDMCLELLENCDPSLSNARLVELAALNNVSQLRFEAGDHFTARKGFDLLAVLMFGGANFCPFIISQFEEGDVRGFLLNIILLQPSLVALAA